MKIVIFVFCAGVFTALAIFGLYSCPAVRRSEVRWLDNNLCLEDIKELRTTKFNFFVYPPRESAQSRVGFSTEAGPCNPRCLQLDFSGSENDTYLGFRLVAAVVLRLYISAGALEFWVKGADNAFAVNRLGVSLNEWPNYSARVVAFVPVSINKTWQKISIPLKSFQVMQKPDAGPDNFSWHIIGVTFTVDALAPDKTAELYIDGIRIVQNGQIISELF